MHYAELWDVISRLATLHTRDKRWYEHNETEYNNMFYEEQMNSERGGLFKTTVSVAQVFNSQFSHWRKRNALPYQHDKPIQHDLDLEVREASWTQPIWRWTPWRIHPHDTSLSNVGAVAESSQRGKGYFAELLFFCWLNLSKLATKRGHVCVLAEIVHRK